MSKDKYIHAGIATAMTIIYSLTPSWSLPLMAVSVHWYCWELAQRIAKDELRQGVPYWWDIRRWSSHARSEALYPIGAAILTWVMLWIAR